MSYVYLQSGTSLFTVGFYDPDGEWQSESDHSAPEKAAERVAYLNGGGDALELRGAIQQLKERVTMLEMSVIDLKTAAAFAPQIEHLRGQMDELETMIAEAREVVGRLEGEDDPFMPTDEEWAAYPWAKLAATDDDGTLWLYDLQPSADHLHDWETHDNAIECEHLRRVTPPADYRTTLRQRPEGI